MLSQGTFKLSANPNVPMKRRKQNLDSERAVEADLDRKTASIVLKISQSLLECVLHDRFFTYICKWRDQPRDRLAGVAYTNTTFRVQNQSGNYPQTCISLYLFSLSNFFPLLQATKNSCLSICYENQIPIKCASVSVSATKSKFVRSCPFSVCNAIWTNGIYMWFPHPLQDAVMEWIFVKLQACYQNSLWAKPSSHPVLPRCTSAVQERAQCGSNVYWPIHVLCAPRRILRS